MRLLVDANLSPVVAAGLQQLGHDAVHVAEVALLTATDMSIAEFAADSQRCVVTSDSDFGTILARTQAEAPSVILLRHANGVLPQAQVVLLEAALKAGEAALDNGAIVTISHGRIRVRTLPIR